jgi:hypothetical protein
MDARTSWYAEVVITLLDRRKRAQRPLEKQL